MKSKPIAQLLKLQIFTLYLILMIKLSQFFPKISFICKESASAFKEKKNIEISVKILTENSVQLDQQLVKTSKQKTETIIKNLSIQKEIKEYRGIFPQKVRERQS